MRSWLLGGLGAAIVLLIALVVIVVTTDDETGEAGIETVSAAELREIAADASGPLYWAGEIDGTEIELTRGNDGSFLVTYLPEDGDLDQPATSIGTYPIEDPVAAFADMAAADGAIVRDSDRVGSVVSNRDSRSSVYFVDPAAGVLVEVFDSDPAEAMRLADSGDVRPVE